MHQPTKANVSEIAIALNPENVEVDGRDSRDRLAFVANFSKLILYYDQNNLLSGNWQPFFLKDPAILLAAISKTEYSAYHAKFMQLQSSDAPSPLPATDIFAVNQLCHLLQSMFYKINQWFHFMELDASLYSLHGFLKKKIEETLSGQLWSMVALQQRLSVENGGIVPPDTGLYNSFEPVWKKPKISAQDPSAPEVPPVAELSRIYHKVFDVFMQVIDSAEQAFYRQENQPTAYPDTALLIAFSQLMKAQQNLINQFSGKHLDFYFERILHQSLRPAQADSVYICLSLADKVEYLSVPAGTQFKAGKYADNSEIVFQVDADSEINRATISNVSTLYYDKTKGLYLTNMGNANKVVKNQLQEIQSWEAFGNTDGMSIRQGFAFASPMLFLQGGVRTIIIDFEFDGATPPPDFSGSQFYLSTEKAWYAVSDASYSIANKIVSLKITLPASDPAIVAFSVNPDGISSSWPMLKVLLGEPADLSHPPLLVSVSIHVDVRQLSKVSIANDISPLPDVGPVQIFGPVPEVGNRFYLGSNECFAKPLEKLTLQMSWDNLPLHFSEYYAPYNQYLTVPQTSEVVEPPIFSNTAFKVVWTFQGQNNLAGLAMPSGTVSLFQQDDSGANLHKSVFTFFFRDCCLCDPVHVLPPFSPSLLLPLPPPAPQEAALALSPFPAAPELALLPLPPVGQAQNGYMYFELSAPVDAFGHSLYAKLVSETCLNNAQLLIGMAKGKAEPTTTVKAKTGVISFPQHVLKKPLTLVRQAVSQLVAQVLKIMKGTFSANQNALQKVDNRSEAAATSQNTPGEKPAASVCSGSIPQPVPSVLQDMPNLPYSPRQASLLVDYSASATTVVSDNAAAYPLELYHYGSFMSYLAYDAMAPENNPGFAKLVPEASPATGQDSVPKLPLFPGVGAQGCLYLALGGVCAPCTINLYAEISPIENQSQSGDDSIAYYYWMKAGWQRLTLLQDETDHLSCSGIIKLDIPKLPADMQTDGTPTYVSSPVMAGADFWIAIATSRNDVRVKLSYLNTQAIKLSRVSMASLPRGETPQIEAGVINAPQNKIAQIAGIVQPFASFGGLPAEDKNSYGSFTSFYRRVSERLNNKDRAANRNDYVNLAHDVCINLYYAKTLTKQAGVIVVGLVNGYACAQLPNAFTPVLGRADQDRILRHIQSRASAMATISVMNLRHQVITLNVSLVISPQANANTLIQDLNQILKVYLSPWIGSDSPQVSLTQGISRSALISFLTSQDNVIAVSALSISLTPPGGGNPLPVQDDPVIPTNEDAILVTAMQHKIDVVRAANVAPIRQGGRSA